MLIFNGESGSVKLSHVISHIETVNWSTLKYTLFCRSLKQYSRRFLSREELLMVGTQATRIKIKTFCPICVEYVSCEDPGNILVKYINKEVVTILTRIYKKEGLRNYVA